MIPSVFRKNEKGYGIYTESQREPSAVMKETRWTEANPHPN